MLLKTDEALSRMGLDAARPRELLAVPTVRLALQRIRRPALQLVETPHRRPLCVGGGVALRAHALELGGEALLAARIREGLRRGASQRRRELPA